MTCVYVWTFKTLLLQELCLIIHNYIVSAEPASACRSFTTENKGVHQKQEDVTQVSLSVQGASTPGGTDIRRGRAETSPETKPPQEKRAKREAGDEEQEEGEIIDSNDEEEEEEKEKEEEGNARENTL